MCLRIVICIAFYFCLDFTSELVLQDMRFVLTDVEQ